MQSRVRRALMPVLAVLLESVRIGNRSQSFLISIPDLSGGTFLPANVVSEIEPRISPQSPLATAQHTNWSSARYPSGGILFRPVEFSLPESTTIAAAAGLTTTISALDGHRQSTMTRTNSSSCLLDVEWLNHCASYPPAYTAFKVWGIFRKGTSGVEFTHSTTIQLATS